VTSDGRVGIGRNAAAAKSGNASTSQVLDRFSEGYSIGQASSLGRSTAVMLDAALRVVERSPWISAVDTTSLGEWIGRSPDAAQEPQPDRTPEPAPQAPEAAPSAITPPASVAAPVAPSTAQPEAGAIGVTGAPTAGPIVTPASVPGDDRVPASAAPATPTSPVEAPRDDGSAPDAGPGMPNLQGSPTDPAPSQAPPAAAEPSDRVDDATAGPDEQGQGTLERLSGWLSRGEPWWARWWTGLQGKGSGSSVPMAEVQSRSVASVEPALGASQQGAGGPVVEDGQARGLASRDASQGPGHA
jgi:hypothetical protein